MAEDVWTMNFEWAKNLAAACGFVVEKTITSPEGYQYSVESIGFGGDEADVTLRLLGQPKSSPRIVTIKVRRPEISWGE
jgi:hypothetical protein